MRDKILAMKFGATIRRLRLHANMSQEEFADRCHLHRTYIGLIERGERLVTIETADKLSRALNISLSRLFKEVEAERDLSSTNMHLTQEE